jgi:hypothetical protein
MDKIGTAALEGMVSMLRKMREDVVPKNSGNREYHAYCTAITAISAIIKIKQARMGKLVK